MSYFYHFADDPALSWVPLDLRQACRAASLVSGSLRFKALLEAEELPVDTMGRDQTPLCMHQYTLLFGGNREPAPGEDVMRFYDSRHIIVLRAGRAYRLEVYHEVRQPRCKDGVCDGVMMAKW